MDISSHGVGPYPLPFPDDPRYDHDLLAHGDTRNVADKYRYWRVDAIRADLARTSASFHVAVENLEHDFNIGSIVRTANAFNAGTVHIIGRRQWNRRGAMVTDRYLEIVHHPDIDSFIGSVGARTVIAVDNVEGAEPLASFVMPADCVLVFGSEANGISDELRQRAAHTVFIEQSGSTRSINVAAAAAIVMYRWVSEHSGSVTKRKTA